VFYYFNVLSKFAPHRIIQSTYEQKKKKFSDIFACPSEDVHTPFYQAKVNNARNLYSLCQVQEIILQTKKIPEVLL
jgi:hypothetical protein